MIKCIGSDVLLGGKVVAHIVGSGTAFHLHFKSGRKLWLDEDSAHGQFVSLDEIKAAVIDWKNRDDIIIAAFTGCLPAPRMLRAVQLGCQDVIVADHVVSGASGSQRAVAMR